MSPSSSSRCKALHVMMEAGMKLRIKSQTLASSAVYFHRFYSSCDEFEDQVGIRDRRGEGEGKEREEEKGREEEEGKGREEEEGKGREEEEEKGREEGKGREGNERYYDPMLLAATCISLATKVEEDRVGLRDIVNVFHRSLHPDEPVLDLGPVYWSLRDSISHLEMILLRFLRSQVTIDHPHRLLLHYLSSLDPWLSCGVEDKFLLARISSSLLSDFYLDPKCAIHDPPALAVSVLQLALQMIPLTIPFQEEEHAHMSWSDVLMDGKVTKEKVDEIIRDLVALYQRES